MNINLIRGDTKIICFGIEMEDGNDFVMSENDKLYFTVKTNEHKTEYVFQKTHENGISYNADNKEYEIRLEEEDTCNLSGRAYKYDIELIVESQSPRVVATLEKGELIIEMDVTHKENED